MRTPLRYLVLAACLLSGGRPALAADEPKPSSDEAKAAALAWIRLVDDNNYAGSWKEASTFFREMVTEQKWEDAMNQVRDPLGSVTKRVFRTAQFTHELPGAPKGDYWVLQFATSFEGTAAVETVTPMLDKDGKWHVSGYFIKPAS